MKGVQCYELFGGIALKIHTFFFIFFNDNKTELMFVISKRTKHLHSLPTSITIGNAQFPFKQSVKN